VDNPHSRGRRRRRGTTHFGTDASSFGHLQSSRWANRVSPATINKQLRNLRHLLRWAHTHHYLREVPDFKEAFPRETEAWPVVTEEVEIDAGLEGLAEGRVGGRRRAAAWWRVFIVLSFSMGTRRGETLGLRWCDIDLTKQTAAVRGTTSKGRRSRVLDLM